jgi:CheY-like chemotaxis protein
LIGYRGNYKTTGGSAMNALDFPNPAVCKTTCVAGGYWSCLAEEAHYCPHRFMLELKYYVCKHPDNYKFVEKHRTVNKTHVSNENSLFQESVDNSSELNKTILLVDDNKLFLEIEKEYLQNTQANVLTAQNGLEVLELLKTTQPNIIFMDLEMPMMDGATCCKAIRTNPVTTNIPVVMVISRGQEDVVNHCYSMGCEYYLTKPLDRDLFLSTARKFITNLDRREKRVLVNLEAELQTKTEKLRCKIYDLSYGGAFLETEYFGNPNGIAQIAFTLPNGSKIECHCQFAWINRKTASHPNGIGIRFALMPKEMQVALNHYVASFNQ